MYRVRKFVGLVLLAALLAAPATAAALSTCWKGMDSAQQSCGAHCPMMMPASAARTAADAFERSNSGTPCCNVSSLPEAFTQFQLPAGGAVTAVAPPQIVLAAVVIAAGPVSSDSPPPLPAASSQAVLCTFLI